MHVVWINEHADWVGGAERYIGETARLLEAEGVRSTLLYGVDGWTEPSFTDRFDAAFPLVDAAAQLEQLEADVVYLHQLTQDVPVIRSVASAGTPSVRFLHDHEMFCLRDHKYTAIGHETCTRPVGMHCYPCLGFVNRTDDWPRVRLRTVGTLRQRHHENMALSGVVVGSRYMQDHVVAHGFERARVHYNPLYVWPNRPRVETERQPERLLFVGGLLRGKGIDLLIEAMAHLPESTQLKVVGEGHQEQMFRDLAIGLGVADRVEFTGRLRGEELARAFASAACLVLPSRAPETFALVGPEAFAYGTPVVATEVGGVGEWLEDGVTGWAVPSGDREALVRAIERVLGDPEGAGGMAAEGLRRCSERLTPERHVNALLALFRSLCR